MGNFNNKRIKFKKEFEETGTFKAFYAAKEFARESGYSCGSTDIGNKVALQSGEYNLPQKIKNFHDEDFENTDGVIQGNFREGPLTLILFQTNFN